MLRLRTDGGKSRPPMGGVRRRLAREGRRDAAPRRANERSARRRDAEGVRARDRHALLFRSRRRAAGNPRLATLTTHAAYVDFSPSTFFECAPVTAGTWYARGRCCFFLFRSSLWQLSVACDRGHFPPLPPGKTKSSLKFFGAKCSACRLLGNVGYKWQTLKWLHGYLFVKIFELWLSVRDNYITLRESFP